MKLKIFLSATLFSLSAYTSELKLTCDNGNLKSIKADSTQVSFEKNAELESKNKEYKRAQAASLCAGVTKCFESLGAKADNKEMMVTLSKALKEVSEQKNTKTNDDAELDKQIQVFNKNLELCNALSEKQSAVGTIEVSYPFAGPNRNKIGKYKSYEIKKIVDHALSEGVDPYLLLGLVFVENPPSIGNSKPQQDRSYSNQFGSLPIDLIAAYDTLGCMGGKALPNKLSETEMKSYAEFLKLNGWLALQKELGKRFTNQTEFTRAFDEFACYFNNSNKAGSCKMLTEQKTPQKMDLRYLDGNTGKESVTKICATNAKFEVGTKSPELEFSAQSEQSSCCAEVKSKLPEAEAHQEMLSVLGARYVKNNIQNCIGKNDLSYCIQKYNGLGCFNCTEKMSNDCFNGIVMADRPVYGARVADLMVNSIMNNPEINRIVQDAVLKQKTPIRSSFCTNGSQEKTIITDQFFKDQKRFLLNGGNEKFKFQSVGAAGARLKLPESEAEEKRYLANEQQRQKACTRYFK